MAHELLIKCSGVYVLGEVYGAFVKKTHKKALFFTALIAVVTSTIAFGLYFKHTTAVVFFLSWLAAELLIARIKTIEILSKVRRKSQSPLVRELFNLYQKRESGSELILEERLLVSLREPDLTLSEQKSLRHLYTLTSFRTLLENNVEFANHRMRVQQAFFYRISKLNASKKVNLPKEVTLQDLMEGAMKVSELYWQVFDAALSDNKPIQIEASALLEKATGFGFDREKTSAYLEKLTDRMKCNHGLAFVILNLISQKEYVTTKHFAQALLTSQYEVEERLRSVLYWIVELSWFLHERNEPLEDHESIVRYLYHLCFTRPERGGFLEIDSQFFSEFDTINELAREAFAFKDDLIESVLMLWKEYEGYFDSVFQEVMEALTEHKSKIHDNLLSWELYWNREGIHLSKEYLYLVEGNVSFKAGLFDEALLYYQKALEENGSLRPALFNLLFVYAKLGKDHEHEDLVHAILSEKRLLPSAWYVIGNSYEIRGESDKADEYYSELRKDPQWAHKADYFRSLFCYEHNLHEKALEYAIKAHRLNPNDSSIKYHLSLCYDSQGEKSRALDLLDQVGEGLEWMDYYRFKLQRDAGMTEQARETLLKIPTSYFEDEAELEEALDFAKSEKDLNLLRHLKSNKG